MKEGLHTLETGETFYHVHLYDEGKKYIKVVKPFIEAAYGIRGVPQPVEVDGTKYQVLQSKLQALKPDEHLDDTVDPPKPMDAWNIFLQEMPR